MISVIHLLSREGDRKEKFEVVPSALAEAAADEHYATGQWYVEIVLENVSKDAAYTYIAASL